MASHWVGFTLPGMMEEQPADVVGDLHQVAGKCLQGTVGEDQLIPGGQGVELIGSGDKIPAGKLGNSGSNHFVKALGGIEPGTHGGAAQSQFL